MFIQCKDRGTSGRFQETGKVPFKLLTNILHETSASRITTASVTNSWSNINWGKLSLRKRWSDSSGISYSIDFNFGIRHSRSHRKSCQLPELSLPGDVREDIFFLPFREGGYEFYFAGKRRKSWFSRIFLPVLFDNELGKFSSPGTFFAWCLVVFFSFLFHAENLSSFRGIKNVDISAAFAALNSPDVATHDSSEIENDRDDREL